MLAGAQVTGHLAGRQGAIMAKSELQGLLEQRLTEELGEAEAAARLTGQIFEIALSWRPPQAPAAQVSRIVAYAFGNRPRDGAGPNDLADPGPVNEALAQAVRAIHRLNPVKIYAQWEIARFLVDQPGMADMVSIEPVYLPDGTLEYLSTDGVAAEVLRHEGGAAASMGAVAIVAHRDHAKRCVQISRRHGMNAIVATEIELPVTYDPLSGQPWTRRRDIYLAHDLAAQFIALRGQAIAGLGEA